MSFLFGRSHRVSQGQCRRLQPAGGAGLDLVVGAVLGVHLALALLTAGPASANEQRRNTPSFGVQGGYGAMNGNGKFEWIPDFEGTTVFDEYRHQDFRYGGALGLRIRYSLDQTHAVGVGFEDLRYGRKTGLESPEHPELEPAKQFQVNTVVIDYYLYLNRRDRATPYLLLGAGLHRDSFRFKKNDNLVTAIGPCANLGIGVEYFIRPAWSLDTTLRGAWFGQRDGGQLHWKGGGAPVATSLQIGFQYYLIK